MITSFLEGEKSRGFKAAIRIALVGITAIGAGFVIHARAEQNTLSCTEELKSHIENKRRAKLSERIAFTPQEIANIESKCRSKYYRSLIGLQ